VLLRVVGVPTRSVNGFLGGEWNSYGHYLAVRQGDAHSWVEVWIDGPGWVTMDPTPPGGAPNATSGAWNAMRQLADNMELAWFKYVIEYDLGKQTEIVSGVRRWAQLASKRDAVDAAFKRYAAPVAGFAAGLAGLWMLVAAWRRRKLPAQRIRRGAEALHAYARALKALERRGFSRGAGETGRELAVRVEQAADPAAAPFSELVELYYAARFGDVPVATAELDRLAHSVATSPPAPEVAAAS
jgi:protein-glutamine gamma-glutamyltransferase